MEVHHRSHLASGVAHTPRNKWTHYLWEFLMLFLAVFCGFLAENQREHMIEHRREKQYMKTLLEDLARDTIDLSRDIEFWEHKIKKIDTIKAELNKNPSDRNSRLLYRCVAIMSHGNSFLFHDRTVNQLKNAGNFRLVREKNVSDSVANYDSYIINTLKSVEANFGDNQRDHLNMQNRFFNSEYFHLANQPQLFDSTAALRPDIIAMQNRDKDLFFEYYNKLNSHARECRFRIVMHQTAMRIATNLINLVKKEYHLE